MGSARCYVNANCSPAPVPRPPRRNPSRSAFVIGTLAVFALCGCAATVDQRGNLPPSDKIAEIHPGTTTKDQVAKLLGTPSSTGVFNDRAWYYISRRTEQVAFFNPDVLDQQVFIVDFDDKNVVKSVGHKGLKDGRAIDPAPGATPAPGRELTFFEQILGNIGRFSGGTPTKP